MIGEKWEPVFAKRLCVKKLERCRDSISRDSAPEANGITGRRDLPLSETPMPLHLGKIASLVALLTIGAFILWLMFGSILTGERADQDLQRATDQPPGAPAQSGQ